jgi:hypothetical protein
MKWAGNLVLKGKKINVYRTFMGKPEGKNLFGRSRPGWENIKIYSKLTKWGIVDCIRLVGDMGK